MKVILAGGGIGGLTAALCLHHFGHDVHVLEQAPELSPIGAGVQISPNAMKVYEKLDISSRLSEKAFHPEALEMRMGKTGERIFSIPMREEAERRWGAPYLNIHRADLIAALSETLAARAPQALQLGQKIMRYQQSASQIDATLADGSQISGDILIGADGIHSAIRAQMLGADKADFTGYIAWRAVVPMEKIGSLTPPPTACVWAGAGKHAVTYRLRGGTLANLVGVVERGGWRSESWIEEGAKEDALSDFEGWHPVITNMIEEAEKHFCWALFDRKPLKRWTDGRAALIGDACHPMLPFIAQGAALAIEDGWVLASHLSEGEEHPARALESYFHARFARTKALQKAARDRAKTFHMRKGLARLALYGSLRLAGRIAPRILLKTQDPFYGYDVTRGEGARGLEPRTR